MPERTEYAPGTPSWIDLSTTDRAAAKEFYGALFGWTYEDQQAGPEATYTMASRKGATVAGMADLMSDQLDQGIPPHWQSYVTVADADETAKVAERAGGTVLAGPFDVVDAGRMAVVQDPTGAILAIWQPVNHIGAGRVNEHGTLTWNELMSPDIDKAAEFYRAVLGWDAETSTAGGMTYTEFKLGGQSIAGGMAPPMEGIPPVWGVYFAVDDTDATVAEATGRGATLINGPVDIPVGRFAVLMDPQGAVFSVIKTAQPLS
jgi:predicted enzyme related to lactoylglutathione lyase